MITYTNTTVPDNNALEGVQLANFARYLNQNLYMFGFATVLEKLDLQTE
jgi:hypothetical protein